MTASTASASATSRHDGDDDGDTVAVVAIADPFGYVASQISACRSTRMEGGRVGWVDVEGLLAGAGKDDDNDDDDDDNGASQAATAAVAVAPVVVSDTTNTTTTTNAAVAAVALIPRDVLLGLLALTPKAGDAHILTSEITGRTHLIKVEELYLRGVVVVRSMLKQQRQRQRPTDDDDEGGGASHSGPDDDDATVQLSPRVGSHGGTNALIPRRRLKGLGVMPEVPTFVRRGGGGANGADMDAAAASTSTATALARSYTIQTNGCQMNVADSERLEGILQHDLGLVKETSDDPHKHVDVVLFNTCSIRDHAEQKLYDALGPYRARKRKGGNVAIIVTGCVAQQEGEALLRKIPEIDAVVGPQYVPFLADVVEAIEWGHQLVVTAPMLLPDTYGGSGGSGTGVTVAANTATSTSSRPWEPNDNFGTKPIRGHTVRAWVNVIYGCNEHCTYCV